MLGVLQFFSLYTNIQNSIKWWKPCKFLSRYKENFNSWDCSESDHEKNFSKHSFLQVFKFLQFFRIKIKNYVYLNFENETNKWIVTRFLCEVIIV